MRVNNIFHSIQGEGLLNGVPMVFIRLQGCNLRCSYCDTPEAQESDGGIFTDLDTILDTIENLNPRLHSWICVTGGEPLMQKDTKDLVRSLKKYDFFVEIETNGFYKPPGWKDMVNSWVADIKCPSAHVLESRFIQEWAFMGRDHSVKFVVQDYEDLEYIDDLRREIPFSSNILVSPVLYVSDGEQRDIWVEDAVEFCKARNLRFSLQWHKMIGIA